VLGQHPEGQRCGKDEPWPRAETLAGGTGTSPRRKARSHNGWRPDATGTWRRRRGRKTSPPALLRLAHRPDCPEGAWPVAGSTAGSTAETPAAFGWTVRDFAFDLDFGGRDGFLAQRSTTSSPSSLEPAGEQDDPERDPCSMDRSAGRPEARAPGPSNRPAQPRPVDDVQPATREIALVATAVVGRLGSYGRRSPAIRPPPAQHPERSQEAVDDDRAAGEGRGHGHAIGTATSASDRSEIANPTTRTRMPWPGRRRTPRQCRALLGSLREPEAAAVVAQDDPRHRGSDHAGLVDCVRAR